MRIDKNTRLLLVSPHPDDEVIGCGGLLGKCKKESGKCLIVYACVGESRQLITTKTDASTRIKEIRDIENFTGFKTEIFYEGKEFCRLDVIPKKEIIEKIEDVIEKYKPNIIAIPCPSSYNQDHRAIYESCITALRPVPKNVRFFVENVIYYYEPYFWANSELKTPNAYLDLSEKIGNHNLLEFKIDLYKCHQTQVRDEPFARSIDNLIRWANIYGKEIGSDIAEAFYIMKETL